MSARVPDLLEDARSQSSEKAGENVMKHALEYENAFLTYLMQFIKEDEVLKDFYIRLIYECEIVQIVLTNRKTTELWELRDLIDEMKEATTIEAISEADAMFHRRLFAIAGEEQFYEWYHLQAKTLSKFLKGFWSYIGYKTDYYEKLMEIHTNIYLAIERQDVSLALRSTQEHFSILLFQLLSVTFQNGNRNTEKDNNKGNNGY